MSAENLSWNPVLNRLRQFVPKISATEQTALDAGTVGWEQSLYNGNPNWDAIFSYGAPGLTEEEQAFLDNEVAELCEMIDNWEIKQNQDLPERVWQFIKDKKFWGMLIDKEYGGLGFSSYARSEIVTRIASRSLDAAVAIMVPNSLGPGELLQKYGTPEQQEKYLNALAEGRETPCFGLTEPNAGSDAFGSMQSKGVVEKDPETGKPVIRLDFDKRYITLGPKASLLGVAFKLEDPDNLLGKGSEPGISLGLLPSDMEGVENGNRHLPMNQTFPNGTIRGKDVLIDPEDHIIGGLEGIGSGDRMLMECLSEGRANSLPSLATAGAQYAAWTSSAYAAIRQQFKTSVDTFPGVQEKLAEMAGLAYTIDATRRATVQMVDAGENPTVPSAIAKYHTTEMMRTAVNAAMDVHAGKAVQSGPNNYLNHVYDGTPVAITVEGANILTRNMLVFGQGSYRLHPNLRPIKSALYKGETWSAIARIGKMAGGLAGSVVRGLGSAVTPNALRSAPKQLDGSPVARYAKDIDRLSKRFNMIANPLSVALGGELKIREDISARMGDALSHLYMASSIIKKFEDNGRPDGELPVARWALENSLYETDQALRDIVAKGNFPDDRLPGLRPVLNAAVSLDKTYARPSFELRRQASRAISTPGASRNAMTSAVYVPSNDKDQVNKLDEAFRITDELRQPLAGLKAFAKKNGLKGASLPELLERAHEAREISAFDKMFIEGKNRTLSELREDISATDEFAADNLQEPVRPGPVFTHG